MHNTNVIIIIIIIDNNNESVNHSIDDEKINTIIIYIVWR